ncbi:hypothetical protein [uncultured Aquimarina sp.]|uniref:hypothetical protein n=1 Tax=uncultured Aquimarina sp. TaxID=575652 RepID=UPI00262F591B|nr:hypothetical protein [uncultured Aquimarina sp.]
MFKNIFKKRKKDLAIRCQTYLQSGPPKHMSDYVPGSLTEIIIAQGAQGNKLDPELVEMASIILDEAQSIQKTEDHEIRDYLLQGSVLVNEILNSQ